MSHEPPTLNNRLINELFEYIIGIRYFQNFKILKAQIFKVSTFEKLKSSEISKFQKFLSFFALSPNVHFMFSGRYWSHIQDFQHFLVGSSFSEIDNTLGFQNGEIYKDIV